MFCKNCGTENKDTQVECTNCKTIINTNIPLSGIERIVIIGFFVVLLATFIFGIIPIIILLGLLYIIKKDKSMKSLENTKIIFLIYLIIISILVYLFQGDIKDHRWIVIFISIIIYLIAIVFFNILKKHEKWIVENGLFADSKNEKSFFEKTTQKIQSIKKEPVNTADELLKWAELKEKGLITDEEFKKAKEKTLNGKL
ncbi:SHOCT domain-containing protein [Aliarcobacter cryaerophilus]|uniref:hypothetical protein n=1 Tax=Aliarcobacter cryaerophilus TaxID=28198 RepID=UPI003DA51179